MFIEQNTKELFACSNNDVNQPTPTSMSTTSGFLDHDGDLKPWKAAEMHPNKEFGISGNMVCTCASNPCSCFVCEEVGHA
jgi:hypothetical protein